MNTTATLIAQVLRELEQRKGKLGINAGTIAAEAARLALLYAADQAEAATTDFVSAHDCGRQHQLIALLRKEAADLL